MSIVNFTENPISYWPSNSRWKTGVAIGIVIIVATLAYCILFQPKETIFASEHSFALVNASCQAVFFKPLSLPIVNTDDVFNITRKEFYERFEGMVKIGAGGEGTVFRAKDKKSKRDCALKFYEYKVSPLRCEVIRASVSHLLDQGVTPHLTRGFETFSFTDTSDPVLSSEMLDGNLEGSGSRFTYEERLTFELQNIHTIEKLKRLFKIRVEDNQTKNRFFVALSNQHTFRGERLMDFDYWKYRIRGVEVYIPKSIHLFKLGDYDHWVFNSSSLLNDPAEETCLDLREFAHPVYWAQYSSLRSPNFFVDDVVSIIKEWTKEPKEKSAKILDMD